MAEMDEDTRQFLSARIRMYRLLVPEQDEERKPLESETYEALKKSMQSFSLGQGSYGYQIPVKALTSAGLEPEEWKEIAPAMQNGMLALTDYHHVTEMDNVLGMLAENKTTMLDALKEASGKLEKRTQNTR